MSTLSPNEYRLLTAQLSAARRILEHPTRYTHARLAYAEAQARELLPRLMAAVGAELQDLGNYLSEMMAQVAPALANFYESCVEVGLITPTEPPEGG